MIIFERAQLGQRNPNHQGKQIFTNPEISSLT